MDTIKQIRAKTRELHDALEKLDFLASIIAESVSLEDYTFSLEQLFHIHTYVETELQAHHEIFVPLCVPRMQRAQVIAQDLRYFGKQGIAHPIAEVGVFGDYIKELSQKHPQHLLGCLYVLEGSKLGSTILIQHLGRALGVETTQGHGLDYHISAKKSLKKDWMAFCDFLEYFAQKNQIKEQICEAAYMTMSHFYALYSALSKEKVCS